MMEEYPNTDRKRNIWAPWRIEYINGLHDGSDDGCFLCRCRDEPDHDDQNLVLWRGVQCLTVLNRFPYTGGHCLVAPYAHLGNFDELDGACMREMMETGRDLQKLLAHTVRAGGFNVGMNIGRCAGAGLPDHLHIHIVPRWAGDTNFMAVLGEVRIIPQSLESLLCDLRQASDKLKLPQLSS